MDHTEDLSARVLLKHILTTEPPRTPVTRSASKAPAGTTATRRSSRLDNKNAGAQTPQNMLRRSLKHKIRESITRKSLPPPKRRTASVVLKRIDTPSASSMLFDDEDTPRHILRNILQTEPVRTPVVHEKAASEEPQVPSANSSIARRSTELSGFDLPDLTIGNVISTTKGLSRKRPRRSLNVTAFEKRLRDGEDVEEQNEESVRENSSLSLSGSTSLSLKTPFVDVHTEKRGLQRRVSNRRKITEEEFGAAVNKRHMGELSSIMQADQGPSETAFSEGFTLGLSKLSEPDITADIIHCNTALYAQPDATTTNHSMIATQDKPTVMASQLQRQVLEMEEEELSQLRKERSVYAFPTEDEDVEKHQEEEYVFEPQEREEGRATDEAVTISQQEDMAKSKVDNGGETAETEEEEAVEAQTEEEEVADSQTEEEEDGGVDDEPETEEEVQTESQSQEEEEDGAADDESEKEEEDQTESRTQEEEGSIDSQSEREEAVDSQTEEGVEPESQEEEGEADSQTAGEEEEENMASQVEGEGTLPDSQNPEEEDQNEEEGAADSQTDEEEAVDSLPEEVGEEEHMGKKSVEEDPAEFEKGKEEGDVELPSTHLDSGTELISRRAHRSEAGVFVPATVDEKDSEDVSESRLPGGKSKPHTTFDIHNSLEMESHDSGPPQAGTFDVPESSTHGQTDASSKEPELDADKENSSTPVRVTHDIKNNQTPDEASAQEEEEDDDDNDDDDDETEDIPSKTPAFVRQRISLHLPDPQASPSVLKNIQASSSTDGEGLAGPQPKRVRKRRSGPPKKRGKGGLSKSYLMGIFKHFAKTKVSADVYPVLQEIMDKFFSRMAEDLETYAIHAKRKTIEVEDAELLLKRQGHVNDKVPVEVLIEKYLRMDQRRLLIPVATSGNVVFPKKRR